MRNDQSNTQPMLEALLERIKRLEASLTQAVNAAVDKSTARLETQIGSLRTDFGSLRTDVGSLRAEIGSLRQETEAQIALLRQEMNTGFAAVHDEISVLGDDIRNARARQKDLLRRMEELESRA